MLLALVLTGPTEVLYKRSGCHGDVTSTTAKTLLSNQVHTFNHCCVMESWLSDGMRRQALHKLTGALAFRKHQFEAISAVTEGTAYRNVIGAI